MPFSMRVGALAGALLSLLIFASCSQKERRRADLLAEEFRNFESSATHAELSGLVDKMTAKLDSLPADGPSGAHKSTALSCVRHTRAMFAAMRKKNQNEAAAEALAGHLEAYRLVEEGMRAALNNIGQTQASGAEAYEAGLQAIQFAGNIGSLCIKVLTPLAVYSPSDDRMSVFESLARAYPTAPKDAARSSLAPLMQEVYAQEDRSSNKSRMRQLLVEVGISPVPPK